MSIPISNTAQDQAITAVSNLTSKITEYSQWRENLIATIDEYIDWPGHAESLNAIQELRLYDIKEILKKDQLVLAFLAEFSRGKTETINALFFLTLIKDCFLVSLAGLRCVRQRFSGATKKSLALSSYRLKLGSQTIH
ncbi:hypothetical protein [Methylotenera sp.]|uniref:hypothetical protein n=1 Tax=Methylotenera sp. TaxID=2051956 RepID=UPI0027363985|nr:hypothetical protein [Methylotenera sp.]MDP3212301.1 hypothetical protein [Methylotenera sp.]